MNIFHCTTQIITGAGSISELGKMNIKRLLLVCDPFFIKNGTAEKIICSSGNPISHIFSKISPDPSVTLAAEGVTVLREFHPDTVIALGGGSAMDIAKAMIYFSDLQPTLVAIPTTSGSGSEVTDFSILTHDGIKHPLVDDTLKPSVAIIDGDLVSTLPPALIAEGGFDLISHAIEAYVARNNTLISNALAAQALHIAIDGLLPSFQGNLSVRQDLHIAATMAGIAFSQAGLGLCHAMSHSLGGEFHIPHGRINAILLPVVIDHNSVVCGAQYAQLARRIHPYSSDSVAIRSMKNTLLQLRRSMKLPGTLEEAGIKPTFVTEKIEHLIDATMNDPCCQSNPVLPTREMVRSIMMEVRGRG